MPRALKAVRKAYVPLAFLSSKSFDGDENRLVGLQPFEDGCGKQLVCAYLKVTPAYPPGEQRAYPREREHDAALLHDPIREPDGLRSRGADYDDQAARRVAHPIRRSENATADGDVYGAGRCAVAAWALR